jgi:tetratricopeptide (TPR) repeat protein
MSASPAAERLDPLGELLLRAWTLEARAETDQVRALLEALPRSQLLEAPELGILLLNAYVFTFERDAAHALERELRPLFDERGNDRLHRRFINFQGILLMRESAATESEAVFRRLEWMSRRAGDDYTLSFACANLGHVETNRFRGADALPHYSRALVLARAQQGSRGVARILWGSALAYTGLEMYAEAQRDYEAARRHQRNAFEAAFMDVTEAEMLVQSGSVEAGARLAQRARAFFSQRGHSVGIASVSAVLARIAASTGDLETARAVLEQARSLCPQNDLLMVAEIEEERAVVAALSGDDETCAQAAERATALYLSAESPGRAERVHRRVTLARSRD